MPASALPFVALPCQLQALIRLPGAQPALRKRIWRAVAGEGQAVSFEQFLIASAHSQKVSVCPAWETLPCSLGDT